MRDFDFEGIARIDREKLVELVSRVTITGKDAARARVVEEANPGRRRQIRCFVENLLDPPSSVACARPSRNGFS